MKYIVILGDGMADRPIEALGNETPLAYAKTPMMDELAAKGDVYKRQVLQIRCYSIKKSFQEMQIM